MGTATTIFVRDPGNRALLDYNGATGAVLDWYAFGAGPNDALTQLNVTANTRVTYIPDLIGSVIGALDSGTGAITKTGYQPYGESPSTAGTFRYTGARIDAETNGLYDFRARMYSPVLGRFLQADPAGVQGGMNLYGYVGNDPLNATDPLGLSADGSGLMLLPTITVNASSGGAYPGALSLPGYGSPGPATAGNGFGGGTEFGNGTETGIADLQLAAADKSITPGQKPEIIGGGGGGGYSGGRAVPIYEGGSQTLGSVLAPGGQPVGVVNPGATSNIRTVSPAEFRTIESNLVSGAQPIAGPPTYPGNTYLRPDGTIIGIRTSPDSGPTIDILKSNNPAIPNGFKVHQK